MQRPCSRTSSPLTPAWMHALVFVLLGSVLASGCAPWVTYPPIDGAAHVGHQRLEPVPTIITQSIRFCNERFANMEGEIVFNLPEGVPSALYHDVARRLGNARPMEPDDERAIHVTEVRVRALDSEVDVVYPRPDGHHELVTLRLRQTGPYRHEVRHSRLWRIHVDPPPARSGTAAKDASSTPAGQRYDADAEPVRDEQ